MDEVDYENPIVSEIDYLYQSCGRKREALLHKAQSRQSLSTYLTLGAGIVTLLGSFLTAAVFTDVLDSNLVKIISAVMIFSSGIATLFNDQISNKKLIDHLSRGATDFLVLRSRAKRMKRAAFPLKTSDVRELNSIVDEYSIISGKYDIELRRFRSADVSLIENLSIKE